MVPSTVSQVAILLILALPGVVYQAVREQLIGPRPEERNAGNRLFRAMAVSLFLDAVYAILAGPQLVELLGSRGGQTFAGVAGQPRQVALVALVCIMLIPATLAWV